MSFFSILYIFIAIIFAIWFTWGLKTIDGFLALWFMGSAIFAKDK